MAVVAASQNAYRAIKNRIYYNWKYSLWKKYDNNYGCQCLNKGDEYRRKEASDSRNVGDKLARVPPIDFIIITIGKRRIARTNYPAPVINSTFTGVRQLRRVFASTPLALLLSFSLQTDCGRYEIMRDAHLARAHASALFCASGRSYKYPDEIRGE